jgi:probable addiction module antidote protein
MKKPVVSDAADYLDGEEVIAEHLNVALASEHPDLFLQAIADVAKARGMAQLAKDTGLGRASLGKAPAPDAKPRNDTVLKLIRALGVELQMTPVPYRTSSGENGRRPAPASTSSTRHGVVKSAME